jgi:hypothetical protein
MANDDKESGSARAARLRELIDRLKSGQQPEEDPDRSSRPENPREFVERRMRELDSDRHDEP